MDGETFKNILKTLEGAMVAGKITQGSSLSRQSSFNFTPDTDTSDSGTTENRPALDTHNSFGISKLDVEDKEDEEEILQDPREWIKVVNAFDQPKLTYNVTQKHFEK